MELIDIMLKRRSMRKYTEDEIPEEKLEKILQAGLLAPTSQNRRPCEFYVINDKATLKKLSKAKKFGAGISWKRGISRNAARGGFTGDYSVGCMVGCDSFRYGTGRGFPRTHFN